MREDPTIAPVPPAAHRPDWILFMTAIAAAAMIVLLGALLVVQIEVTDAEVAATRSCGSVFDSIVDRSGWERWWVSDLDESDVVRSALVRTTQCPSAVNARVAIAATLGIIGFALGALSIARRRGDRSSATTGSPAGRRVVRIGRRTSVLGGVLTSLGIIAIIVLVADADSPLFLYTDRLVVAVLGLIVLIPTITLFVLGRVLVLVGESGHQLEREQSDG